VQGQFLQGGRSKIPAEARLYNEAQKHPGELSTHQNGHGLGEWELS